MSKLFTLKSWLTLEDAAKYLSSVLSEEVTPADILQLGLEGHLKLSVNLLNKGYLRKGEIFESINAPVSIFSMSMFLPKNAKPENYEYDHLIEEANRLNNLPLHEFDQKISEEMKKR